MNIIKISSKDVKVLLFIKAPFMALLCYTFFGKAYFTNLKIFVPATLAAVVLIIVFWRLHLYADQFFRKKFVNSDQTQNRIALSLLFHFGIDLVVITILFLWADAIHFLGYTFSWQSYISGLLVGLCDNVAVNSFHEGVYIFENWKRTLIEAEELKKLALKNRLARLRNQTDPHFFFNSINTLSGLIEVNEEKANRFLDEMCNVYRYLLWNEPDTFVPLHKEINFIRSWIYIAQTRYGSSLQVTIQSNVQAQNFSVPRLSLLAFLEDMLDSHIIDKKTCFKVTIGVKNDCVEILHSAHKRKPSENYRHNGQIEEVKTMHRLLGLPPIEEQTNGNVKTIQIRLHHSVTDHEHL
ncbi:MAG: hypothetical protein BroJett042_07170 [Bacteroidota bacterium]|nr:MAG: hypothetical protein BroJett042_07170 [Bacteroidota bacterium]